MDEVTSRYDGKQGQTVLPPFKMMKIGGVCERYDSKDSWLAGQCLAWTRALV